MKQAEFLDALEKNYQNNVEISRRKNSDYAGCDDAFKNFRLIETLTNGKISAEMGILVRMTDKMQRISNLMNQEAQVKDEQITDTLADLANYSMILKIYLENERGKKD